MYENSKLSMKNISKTTIYYFLHTVDYEPYSVRPVRDGLRRTHQLFSNTQNIPNIIE